MAAQRPPRGARSAHDRRRRELGQNFLSDPRHLRRFLDGLGPVDDDLVVDIGAGRGALTIALAERGARVWAVEIDRTIADELAARVERAGLADRVRIIRTDLRRLRLPNEPHRVAANPPFGLTTELLGHLLDDPTRGPDRADLILEAAVARKHAAEPPIALRTAAWAPWWRFERGPTIPRSAFRPVPSVDAAVLRIERRRPAVLPVRLAPSFRATLRADWERR